MKYHLTPIHCRPWLLCQCARERVTAFDDFAHGTQASR